MIEKTAERIPRLLLPVIIAIFIIELFLLPLVINYTYSGRSESSEHTITYSDYMLTWDEGTPVDKNGTAQLSVFDAQYDNVTSGDGDKIIAPGTEGDTIIRLKNGTDRDVTYTAILYEIKNCERLVLETDITGYTYEPIEPVVLPDHISKENVLKSVRGTLGPMLLQDFDITWHWNFEEGQETDILDTSIGNSDGEDTVVGCYITVDDEGETIVPKTGDSMSLLLYACLIFVSLLIIIIVFSIGRKKEKQRS